jgi:hypothetical protein
MDIGEDDITFTLKEIGIDNEDRISALEQRLQMLESFSATTGDITTGQVNAG